MCCRNHFHDTLRLLQKRVVAFTFLESGQIYWLFGEFRHRTGMQIQIFLDSTSSHGVLQQFRLVSTLFFAMAGQSKNWFVHDHIHYASP